MFELNMGAHAVTRQLLGQGLVIALMFMLGRARDEQARSVGSRAVQGDPA